MRLTLVLASQALFGRNWGCRSERPFLHMARSDVTRCLAPLPRLLTPLACCALQELCYYQAIEEAIQTGLSRVEAGAQGEHKMSRGYLPTTTYSAHYIRSPDFRGAISDFLRRETQEMARVAEELSEESPYK
jgi:predicted N-acyltransferase